MKKPAKGIQIHGKTYMTVAERVNDFRDKHGDDYAIITEIIQSGDIVQMLARIENETGRTIATGFAEERRGSTQINKTSALENCETSAIGRALANLGFGGTEYASANEVENAIHQQREGQSQGSDQGAVSPPAKGWREPDSMYNCKTALHRGLTVHQAELTRIGNEGVFDDLDGYLTSPEYQEFIKIATNHAPHYLEGGEPAPEEFVGCFALEQRARDMIAIRGNRPMEKEPT